MTSPFKVTTCWKYYSNPRRWKRKLGKTIFGAHNSNVIIINSCYLSKIKGTRNLGILHFTVYTFWRVSRIRVAWMSGSEIRDNDAIPSRISLPLIQATNSMNNPYYVLRIGPLLKSNFLFHWFPKEKRVFTFAAKIKTPFVLVLLLVIVLNKDYIRYYTE